MAPERKGSWSGTEEVQKGPSFLKPFLREFLFPHYWTTDGHKMSREISPTATEVNPFKGSVESEKHPST